MKLIHSISKSLGELGGIILAVLAIISCIILIQPGNNLVSGLFGIAILSATSFFVFSRYCHSRGLRTLRNYQVGETNPNDALDRYNKTAGPLGRFWQKISPDNRVEYLNWQFKERPNHP